MPDLMLRKNFGRLEGADPVAVDYLGALKIGEVVNGEGKS